MADGRAQDDVLQDLYDREEAILSEWGFKSRDSAGRKRPEPDCPVRTPFQRDRDRILHSKAFRRLKHKTQVFLAPEGDHYRTRMTHTLEVTQIARTIGRALGLNEDLIESVGLGHDLGHTPFGHEGEKVINDWCMARGMIHGFQHHRQSVRVVEVLENNGAGLNLTLEVIEGILKHTKGRSDYTLTLDSNETLHWEGRVVKISDRIAYVNHDLQDAIYSGIINEKQIPPVFIKKLGSTNRDRISSMVTDIITTTRSERELALTPEMQELINSLKDWLFENVYYQKSVRAFDDRIRRSLEAILDLFFEEKDICTRYLHRWIEDEDERLVAIVDYVAGMTDRYAIRIAQELLLPTPWPI